MVAEVIINRTAKKLNRTFDYKIPKNLEDIIIVGSKVLVPFGKGGKLEEGFVVGIKEKSEYEIKEISKLEDNLTENQICLARWMAKRYFCNVSDCIKLMLTPGTRNKDKEKRIRDKKINCVFLKKDIEEIVQCYDRFVDIVKEISMNAKEQIIKLKGTIIADELASDFSEIGMMYAKELLENEWLTQEQYTIAKSIDEMLVNMSERKELWSEEALFSAEEWEECRKKGKLLLEMLE